MACPERFSLFELRYQSDSKGIKRFSTSWMITKLATKVIALFKCYEALSQTRSSFLYYKECGSQSLPKQQNQIFLENRGENR